MSSAIPQLSIVIPAYNEENTIVSVVKKLLHLPFLTEIIIVDDASTDATHELALHLAHQHAEVRVLRQPSNSGKTAALNLGFAETRGDIVVIQDADLEYDPAEIPDLIQPIVDGIADVVYGSRFLVRKAARVLYFYHYLANRALTFFSNLLTNVNLSDVETGYKAFRGDIIRNVKLTSTRFGFEIEITAKVAKLGCAMYEIPISYYGRTYEQGKKIGLWDGLAAMWFVIKYNIFCTARQSFYSLPALSADPTIEVSQGASRQPTQNSSKWGQ